MEAAMLWVGLFGTVAALASAVFAYVQAKAATDSRRDADAARDESRRARDESARLAGEANAAFIRQAEAQETANRIRIQEMTPPDWKVSHVAGDRYRGTNTSQQLIVVDSFEVKPDSAESLTTVETSHLDGRYEYGDSFEFLVARAWGVSPEKLTVRYRYESDNPGDFRRFHITL
ncbi:hypothetical protein [Microbacterium caowuchunii]|uniref:Uncharacterized protein n=1 Tax=Microbacterium caowuchunii TaxID=2614638 RepID=A0A5N0TIL0_9MICO|nr:hypothetical protein [Microbacterium caowuchunii]KAA9133716.1 hypothetical protein F6B40_08155 [Microbacterium caowuchunii]